MAEITRKLAIFTCFLFTGLCFWKVGAGLIDGADASVLPSAQAALSPAVTPPRVVTTPIQEMRPGMRVVGRNPIRIETESTIDPTPDGWRLVSVRMLKPDGTYFEAELLRPLSWIRRHRARPGAVIELNMPEMYVVGAAEVLSISDCPPIDPGDGPVVLSTFKNIANNVLNIYVEGETEPIGVTAGHPIWSEDRQAFIHSDQLQPGERLRSALGRTVRITSIEIRAGPEPVYNLEVAGEHVYSVTNSGLLVHNIGCEDLSTTIDVYSSNHLVSQFNTINVPNRGLSVDDALGRAADFMDLGTPIRAIDGKTGVQFIQEAIDSQGRKITKRVGFDLNPSSPHVRKLGPHLNLQTQIDGVIQKSAALKDPHFPIDPTTIISDDF
ncbi:polymorphic toxin-type HINT domain-containing protein [uncultured Gimesia sp.]|uniref:polymorphic toxin-type HINT domain-containing protein n=1 Tax=uncultured Gimesia sp. TaxID=1678688 RepID=UPI0030D84B60|tara:strand:- start:4094 stop:5239 length:1146 start_codon:yes stop_codon:yes gene_type:complete